MLDEIERVKETVKTVLMFYHDARNSDKKLLLRVWEKQGLILNEAQKGVFLNECSPAETIRRVRQKLQSEGQFQADKAIVEQRAELERETHIWATERMF